jgi:hypothetical protein
MSGAKPLLPAFLACTGTAVSFRILFSAALKPRGARIAQSVWRIATGWTVRGSNPGGGGGGRARFFAPVQTGPGGPPSLLYNGLKWAGHGVDHPPRTSAEVKERVEQYFYSPSGPSWPVLG